MAKQEIAADIARSNVSAATGGGLIAAIIDVSIENSRAKKAEKSIVPVRDALVGYEPGNVLAETLRQELAALNWLKNDAVTVRQAPDARALPDWIKQSGKEALLFVSTDYHFTPAFDAITVTARVSIHPRSGALVSTAKTLRNLPALVYSNVFAVTLAMPAAPAAKLEPAAACELWAANKGEKVRATLAICLGELSKMIAFDLEQPAPANNALYQSPDPHTGYVLQPTPGSPVPAMTRTFVEKEGTNNFAWRRHPGGELTATVK